jgi:hypothetical protein
MTAIGAVNNSASGKSSGCTAPSVMIIRKKAGAGLPFNAATGSNDGADTNIKGGPANSPFSCVQNDCSAAVVAALSWRFFVGGGNKVRDLESITRATRR